MTYLIGLTLSNQARADVGITAGIEQILNPLRRADNDDDEMLSSLTIDGNLMRETERIAANLNYSASKYEYKYDLLDDREIVNGLGSIIWKISPDVLQWNLSNTRTNQLIDVASPDTLDNRQVISITSTGPALTLPLGSANQLDVTLDYTKSDYATSSFLDQNRKTVNAGFTRNLSRHIQVALRSMYTTSDFAAANFGNFEMSSVSINPIYGTETVSLSLELGQYQTKRTGAVKSTSPLLRLQGSYQLNSRSQIAANFSRTVDDLLGDIRSLQSGVGAVPGADPAFPQRFGNSDNASVYQRETKGISYAYVDTTRFTFRLEYNEDVREILALNRNESDKRLSMDLQVPVTSKVNISILGRLSELDFGSLAALQKRGEYGGYLRYRLNSRTTMSLTFTGVYQDSENPLETYKGTNVGFSISYRR